MLLDSFWKKTQGAMKTVEKLLLSLTLWKEHDTDQRANVSMWEHLAWRQSNDRNLTRLYYIDESYRYPLQFSRFFFPTGFRLL